MPASGRRDSRGLILNAAWEELGRYGPDGGRVERVARRAGVNKQLVFYYFGSKAGLFRAVAEAAWRRVESAAETQPGDSPLDALRLLAERLARTVVQNRAVVRMTLAASPDLQDPIYVVTRAVLSRLDRRVRQLISEGQGLGYVRDDVEPAVAAQLLLATAVGWVALAPDVPPEEAPGAAGLLLRALTW